MTAAIQRSTLPRHGGIDALPRLLAEGYEFVTRGCRATGSRVFATRLGGIPVVCMQGVEAARLFYDEERFRRAGAVPRPVRSVLFGLGGVQGLDDAEHRHRRQMLRRHLTAAAVDGLRDDVIGALRQRLDRATGPVDLHREAGLALTVAVHDFCGVPLPEADIEQRFRDLQAMVTGAAALGPGRARAMVARRRVEMLLSDLVERTRAQHDDRPDDPLTTVSLHRDLDGRLLPSDVAAVELLNLMRPTVAVNWYVGLLAVALARHPDVLDQLRGDPAWRVPVVQEVRRHLPFFPFVAARTRTEVTWDDITLPDDTRVLLDLYGTNHDPDAWDHPARFDPARFVDRLVGAHELVPQGGGDEVAGHRCVGEQLTIRLLEGAAGLLADGYSWCPAFEPVLPRGHLPTLPPGGVVLTDVRARRSP